MVPPSPHTTQQVHATCVALPGADPSTGARRGVLLRGPSGAGKSDLALRLIDGGGVLVADDRVDLTRNDTQVLASVPPALTGLLEVRGIGIIQTPSAGAAPVHLVVDLIPSERIERLPQPMAIELCGITLPAIKIAPFESSAPAKVRQAVRALTDGVIKTA